MDGIAKQEIIMTRMTKFAEFRAALTHESDRGCALFAAAYLDVAICDLIRASLVESNNVEDDLFAGTAPLSTFSARIKLAYYMGKISREARSDLDIVRRIRNDFAHDATALTFEAKVIAARCRALQSSYHEKAETGRAHYTAAVSSLLALLHASTLKALRPSVPPDTVPSVAEKDAFRKALNAALDDLRTGMTKKKA
jgi:DNA-binding MltR family transcriptional regulator